MKRGTTLFLKLAVILIGIPVLVLCILLFTKVISDPVNPDYASFIYPIIFGMFITTLPFYFALVQAFKLLLFIDQNNAFSNASVKALNKIKFAAFIISGVHLALLPFVFGIADLDDAPGLVFVGMVIPFVSAVVGVFAAVLQKLLHEAINMKLENDLTV